MIDARMRIVIGYDGSDCANAALADLPRAGLPSKAEAVIVSTTNKTWLPAPSSANEPLDTIVEDGFPAHIESPNALQNGIQGCRHVLSMFPAWDVRVRFGSGSSERELMRQADEWGADLIVTGSHRRSTLERLVRGKVLEKRLIDAASSVRIGRSHSASDDVPIVIIIGVDDSANAQAAVLEVATREWPMGTHAQIVAAVHPVTRPDIARSISPLLTWPEKSGVGEVAPLRRIAEAAAEELRSAGLDASLVVRRGDPKLVLVDEARQYGADCIFLGARGNGPFKRLLLGSVSWWVAAHAPCSVEVVRRPSSSTLGRATRTGK